MKTVILGGAYTARSPNAAANRMINLYPEAIPEGGKSLGYLMRCPGLRLLASIGAGPIRGLHTFGGKGYVVSGDELFQFTPVFVATRLGIVSGSGPVSMADNGTQLFIACNPNGYIFNATTVVFQQITDPDFLGAVRVGYLDGYFVFNEPNSQKVWVTSLLNGLAIDPLEYASVEGSPDQLMAVVVDHREAWMFGANSIEIFTNVAALDFPLERIQGAFIEIGCSAPYSIARLDNSLFWLGSDARGGGIVYRAVGYAGQRVSDHALEFAIQSYGNISDAVAYTYQQDGHSFYVITFPGAEKTWAFDVATKKWHERAGFSNGILTRHRGSCHVYFNGQNIVGDYQYANIYAYDLNTYTDNDNIQKWVRSWRAPGDGVRRIHQTLQIDIEAGIGTNTGQGVDPSIMLRWSDDGGHTWSNEHAMQMGKMGDYQRRAIRRRLGHSRDRIYEISGTDPVKIAIMGAELNGK